MPFRTESIYAHSTRFFSTFVFLPPIPRIFCVSRSRLVPQHLEMAFSRPTSLLMEASSNAISSLSAGEFPNSSNWHTLSNHYQPHSRLPDNFSKPIEVDLPISHAGAFAYWVEYDGSKPGSRIKGREGYFNIDPILHTKARAPILSPDSKVLSPSQGGASLRDEDISLPLSTVSILSTVSKWMGPVSRWPDFFAEARDRGYNMLHWTPLQERG